MKRKLIAAYLLVMLSLFIPTSLASPSHIGSMTNDKRSIVDKLEPAKVEAMPTLETVPVSVKDIAYQIASKKGWSGKEWDALVKLWGNESGWNTNAVNPSSGACGIPQAWPCSKIGANWRDPETQLTWGADYIQNRYTSPSKALSFWYAQCGGGKGCWY